MNLFLIGLNYQTTSVELRERFYLDDDSVRSALRELHCAGLSEVVILSTCNRLEIVACIDDAERQIGVKAIQSFLARSGGLSAGQLTTYIYCLEGQAVVGHLMRVAAGLESLVLGETQILGQVAHALVLAQSAQTDGAILSRLFTAAVHAGKRARHETAISQHTLSVSHAAVSLLKSRFEDISTLRALVIGAGEMGELAARALQMHGVTQIIAVNRTDEKAVSLARRLGIQAARWEDFPAALHQGDVVIAATSAPQPLIRRETVARHENPLLLVDIGVPRNIDPQIADLPNIQLYDIDDLRSVVDEHRGRRQSETEAVEAIIAHEQGEFEGWLDARPMVPLIAELRGQAEAIARHEVEQTLQRLPDLNPREQEIVAQLAHRIVNKLLHAPTVNLKSHVAQGDPDEYADTIRQLFALDGHPVNHD
ncbi:MAG: glutamyl-tRNA reductase [Anaerolineae bacterium]|nr:glutamyl-tRNA reductase [Anaerolineae bacterium]